jgi:hypothetical protein
MNDVLRNYLNSDLKYNCIKQKTKNKIFHTEKPHSVQQHINELYILIEYLQNKDLKMDEVELDELD